MDEIDFQALVSNEKVHSVAEIVLVNHDKLEASVLQQHLEEISFRALPSALVDKIMVDVGDMKVGDVIKSQRPRHRPGQRCRLKDRP